MERFGFQFEEGVTDELREVARKEGEDDGYFIYFEKTGLFFTKK